MSSRLRIFGLLFAIFLIAGSLISASTAFIIRPQLRAIEGREVTENVSRAADAYANRIKQLETKLSDWATWSDTYDFMFDHNQGYIDSNLQDESIANLNISYILYYDTKGTLVYSKAVSENASAQDQSPFIKKFSSDKNLLPKTEAITVSGLINGDFTPVLFAAKPILRSDGTGPMRGTIVFAQHFSHAEHEKISAITHLKTDFLDLETSDTSQELRDMSKNMSNDTVRQISGKDEITAYRLIYDIYDQPALLLEVITSREFYNGATRALNYYILVLAFIMVLISMLSWYGVSQITDKDRAITLKNEFFSMASHELRTPLTAIKGNAQIVRDYYGKDDEGLRQLAQDVHQSSERLIKIVTNFLDAARLEQNKIAFDIMPTDIVPIIETVVSETHAMAAEKKIEITTSAEPTTPFVMADKDRVKQILYNLIGNALKFTDEGNIRIHTRLSDNHLIVDVSDTGRGISEQGKQALFRKFQQTQKEDSPQGSGLGLYISKLLAQKMGGSIWLDSSIEGVGSTFSFSLTITDKQPENGTKEA